MSHHSPIFETDKQHSAPTTSSVFNYPNADVVVQSYDGVLFRVHKVILSLASPVFADMFALGKRSDVQIDTLPVVPAMEDFETAPVVEAILRFCYPVNGAKLEAVADLYPVLKAAKKYMIEEALKSLRPSLVEMSTREPLQAFVYAASLRFDVETRATAKNSLRVPLPSAADEAELDLISGRTYQRLLKFRLQSIDRVHNLFRDDSWIDRRSFFQGCLDCCAQVVDQDGAKDVQWVAGWWREYMRLAELALEKSVTGEAVLDQDILLPPTLMAASCGQCKNRAITTLRRFSKVLADQVDSVIYEEAAKATFF
ncbi:hypothetical protein JAAARDRAFT_54822 [Jaapia argillacea MUCL 33604]|uniref:BTB domain-containing protein n=1 Tax=Jaapia argillacea MUCL 33604 TaxID=933084 RepID=A0A067QFU7_9AGAM|nr:hypothetical protein JAAARDRAFT_54822 [Jaapia argillacea MUCL 33604]